MIWWIRKKSWYSSCVVGQFYLFVFCFLISNSSYFSVGPNGRRVWLFSIKIWGAPWRNERENMWQVISYDTFGLYILFSNPQRGKKGLLPLFPITSSSTSKGVEHPGLPGQPMLRRSQRKHPVAEKEGLLPTSRLCAHQPRWLLSFPQRGRRAWVRRWAEWPERSKQLGRQVKMQENTSLE